jgi:hypothetical protein
MKATTTDASGHELKPPTGDPCTSAAAERRFVDGGVWMFETCNLMLILYLYRMAYPLAASDAFWASHLVITSLF